MTLLTLFSPAGVLVKSAPLTLAAKRLKALGFEVREIFLRLRLEYDHRGWLLQPIRLLRQLTQHRLMTEMDAIEIADGCDAAPVAWAQVVQTADEFHDFSSELRVASDE